MCGHGVERGLFPLETRASSFKYAGSVLVVFLLYRLICVCFEGHPRRKKKVEQSANCFVCFFWCENELKTNQMHSLWVFWILNVITKNLESVKKKKNPSPVNYLIKLVSTVLFADGPSVILQSKQGL